MRIAAMGIAMPGINMMPKTAASQSFSPCFSARTSPAKASKTKPVDSTAGGFARVNLRKLLNLKTPLKDQIRIRLPKR